MQQLKLELKKNGFVYKQIKRTPFAAMYRAYLGTIPSTFEVFKIKIRKAGNCIGYELPESEIFPSNAVFGNYAWSIGGINAEQRANELFNEIKDGEVTKANKMEVVFNNYKIIKYFNGNIIVLEDGKLSNKPKDIIRDYIKKFFMLNEELIKSKTIKELGEIIF